MAPTPPSLSPAAATPRWPFADAVLAAALAAHKAGTLDELLQRRPRATRWLARRLLAPVHAVAGDAVTRGPADAAAWRLLLRATLARLRPDGRTGLDDIDADCWTTRSAWRPLLALACHHGFIAVAVLPQSYRARPDESAAEQLCGLWDVGPSTFYRHLDRGRRLLADALLDGLLASPPGGERSLVRQALLQHEVHSLLQLPDDAARRAWHARQAASLQAAHREGSGQALLWHLLGAGEAAAFIAALQSWRIELAGQPDTDALLRRFAGQAHGWRSRFELQLAWAGLARVRGDEAAERQAYDDALRLASTAGDALALGVVYGALGKFNEPRDADRAFACYQESADFLQRAGLQERPVGADAAAPTAADAAAAAEQRAAYLETLVKLAWLYVLRNDPRSRAVLDRAEAEREHTADAATTLAMLEQAWGEYWRRSGDLRQALEHKHRALHIYERLGDRPAILKTYANLALVYGDGKDFARAIDYSQRVLAMAERLAVEPETVAGTHQNLGAAYFWQGKYELAIDHYKQALVISQQARLRVFVGRAHYNLAEAYYKRFQALDRPEDERLGDAHSAAALATWPEGDAAAADATRSLKAEILGPRDGQFYDRLLPGEFAAHFDAMAEVQRHRAALALPLAPPDRIHAHLAIALAYADIAAKERDAALLLMDKHGGEGGHVAALRRLREALRGDDDGHARQAEAWCEATAALLPQTQDRAQGQAQSQALLQHLLRQRAINKSGYALLCGVGLATASKQLGRLADADLLVQTGKGPSTRYLLPEALAGAGVVKP
jgi:tetratricopeptide (TPR) repeat protein